MKKSKKSDLSANGEKEKAKREAELVIANKELVNQKSEKSKRAAEYVVVSKELVLSQDKEKLIEELNTVNEELRKIKKVLFESEERFQLLFDKAPLGYQSLDIYGNFIDVNQQWADTLGYTRAEVIGKWFGDFLTPDCQDGFRKRFPIFLAEGKMQSEFEMVHKNGKKLFIAFEGSIGYGTNGDIKQTHCILQDITERKKMELSLEESKKTAERYLNVAAELIMSLDALGNITMLNDSGHRLLGYNKDELIGKNWFSTCLPHETAGEISGVFEKLMIGDIEKLENKENLVLTKSGELKTIQFYNTILKDIDGTIKGIISSGRDITDHLKAEETLRNSFVFSETLLKTIPFGMDIVDEKGTILFLSDNFKKIFGESAIGKKCWELYRDDKKQCSNCPLFTGVILGETETYESHGVLGDRIFDISHTGMLYQGRRAMLEIFQDVTERKKVESELIKAKEKAEESDRLKSAFLTNMSHEIRTPMNGILGFAELLKEPNLSIDVQQDYIQTMQVSGSRMLNTINSIVNISKIESGLIGIDIKETNLNEKIEFTYKFFKPEVEIKGLQFLFKNGLPKNEAIIKTDNEKVYAILTNLVRNAIKFTFNGSIEFGYEKKGEYLEFFVKDTGIGIPKKMQQLVFERFRQGSESHNRGYEGSGLGLSICKSYVEMLGGRIWVESEEGSGSTFYFTIPYNPVSEEISALENDVSAEQKEVPLKKLKILVVEDDEISYSLLTRTLQKISKEVLHAITGIEAVEACRNNPDLDLVLMDIRMPRMNGLEATQQIRQFNKAVIIIAQTAYAFTGDSEKAIEAGCNDYISKPINRTLLYELIGKHFNK